MKQSNGYWIAIGVGIGTAIAGATGNWPVWIAAGVTFGAIMSATVGKMKGKTNDQLK
ncbi:MAG: hypothetical protein AB8G95_27020 [Anaerolineae bacterium]